MNKPLVEHVKRPLPISGKRVYIGRRMRGYPEGPYGNPFGIDEHWTREKVIEKYRAWIAAHPEIVVALAAEQPDVLACWCAPRACHGDVLAELVAAASAPPAAEEAE